MKTENVWIVLLVTGWLFGLSGEGKTVYLVPPGTPGVIPLKPYTNGWASASTNLAGVMDFNNAAEYSVKANDVLLISNGVYNLATMISPLCPGALIQSVTTNPADVIITPGPGHPISAMFYFNGGNFVAESTWQGLTFSNGANRAIENYGATNVTFRNCVFTDNHGNVNGSAIGTMFASYNNQLRLFDCTFRNNGYGTGGALSCCGVLISNCLFVGNSSTQSYAGAIEIISSTLTSLIEDCTFINNTNTFTANASPGGAGYNNGPLRMSRCSFISNSCAGGQGGGWTVNHTNTVISDCRFLNNQANFGGGLAFNASGSAPGLGGIVSNCLFTGNTSAAGGAASFYYGNNNLLVNCVFSNNVATAGGAICTYPGAGEVRNCLIVSNMAANGGAIRINSVLGTPFTNHISSCTIAGNYASGNGGGIFLAIGGIGDYDVRNSIVFSNSCANAATKDMQNAGSTSPAPYFFCCTSSNFPAGNNITNPPKFVDFASGNYRQARHSPCIDAGTNLSWMASAVELGNRPRIIGDRVDIGAYEFKPEYLGTILAVY